jgi:hypothetical protein
MAISGFGKPKYKSAGGFEGGGGSNYWNVKEGDNVYRVLPPVHSLADDGKWAIYFGTHFGYRGTADNGDPRGRMKTFRCIEEMDFRTRMIRQDCPACDAIKAEEEALKEAVFKLKSEGKSEDEIDTETHALRTWLKDHNCDRKWHLNVMREDGTFGVLKLNHKTQKKQLDGKIAELLEKEGIDALDLDQGVWFNFKRTGKKLEATDVIEVVHEDMEVEIKGKKVRTKVIKPAPLTEEQQTKALKDCVDLSKIGTTLTYEQLKMVVECGDDMEEIDKVFNMSQKVDASARAASAPPKNEPKPAPKSLTPPAKASGAEKNAAVEKRMAEIAARKAEAERKAREEAEALLAAQAASSEEEAATPASDDVDPLSLSDEEFTKLFGGG